ncbi:hypothetical protein TPA0910_84910 [Streptomyces hygroscopicus subsp. sporocinereus]|uniref:Uncharacterized protein n=1 Tax=Streptomyces hygroscopicus TaxID=1912 RepID=A0ABQ3UFT4_STRHY|nr:hypothetical protein TPA0910_84910 [Streptomyces hygroscopicus]
MLALPDNVDAPPFPAELWRTPLGRTALPDPCHSRPSPSASTRPDADGADQSIEGNATVRPGGNG